MASPARQSLRRTEFSYASDTDIADLFDATRNWLTSHGRVFMRGEIYGLPRAVRNGRLEAAYPLMRGTQAVEYWVRVGLPTIQEHAPDAIESLGVTAAGLEIAYGEPYCRVGPVAGEKLMPGHIRFIPLDEGGGMPVTYDIVKATTSGGTNSVYTDRNHEIPQGAGGEEVELKTHEHQALMAIVDGLGALTRTDPLRQEFAW